MKTLKKKDLTIAILTGLLVGAILSAPLIYTVNYTLNKLLSRATIIPTPSVQEQVENIIRIPIDIAAKNKQKRLANYTSVDLRVTFYTGLAHENGGYAKMNAIGGKLKTGSLAAPKDIPFGTVFFINDLPFDAQTNTFVVDDRGDAITWLEEGIMKVDVYIKRNPGENDIDYFKRVNDLGVIYTTAKYKLAQ